MKNNNYRHKAAIYPLKRKNTDYFDPVKTG